MSCYFSQRFGLSVTAAMLSLPAMAATNAANLATDSTTADTMVVTATPEDGSTTSGYLSDTVQATKPWGDKKLQDTPYSINSTSAELMQNKQITSADDVFRTNPFTQFSWPSTRNGQTWMTIRGLNVYNKTVDGLTSNSYEVDPVENKERVEVLNGLSGFINGQADPGGSVNYVLKRPRIDPFADVTVANPGGKSGYVHADFGSPIDDDGRFAYRINVVKQAGKTEVDKQHEQREMLSGAFDWHITDRMLLQLDYEHAYSNTDGAPPTWNFSGQKHPSAPDQDKLWSQPWTYTREQHNKGGARLNWEMNDNMTLRLAGNYSDIHNQFLTYNIANVASNGHYLPFASAYYPIENKGFATSAFLDNKFSTGSIDHLLTVGYSGSRYDMYEQENMSQVCMNPVGTFGYANCTSAANSPFSIQNPVYIDMPGNFWDRTGGKKYKSGRQETNNYIIGDDITLTEQWSIMAGVNYANMQAKNYNTDGSLSQSYDKSRATPTVSLIFKPVPYVTTYLTYIEGLEQGQVVGSGYTNTGSVQSPLVSKQYEAGVKVAAGDALLTMALYQIDKPNQYSNNAVPVPTYVQDGEQQSRGIELGVTGKLTERLTAVGGATFMHNEVKKSNDPESIGKRPQGVADKMSKAYLEYEIPGIEGLVLTGGANYTGDFSADAHNTEILPSVVTFDAGARYTTVMNKTQLISRVYVTNLTNKNYWISSNFTGEPRTLMYSLTASF